MAIEGKIMTTGLIFFSGLLVCRIYLGVFHGQNWLRSWQEWLRLNLRS